MKVDTKSHQDMLSTPLSKADPEVYDLVASERSRQQRGLSLVASENIASAPILQTLSSCLANKYCEGLPKPRDLGSNKYLDRIEHMCQERALQAFNLPPAEWGVNVQPYCGTPANTVVYTALLHPHERIMYLDVLDGGHLSHGHMTLEQRVAGSSIYFETMPYNINPRTGLIDYGGLAKTARKFKPKLIIAGSASYSRCLNYRRFRQIADEVGAYLMADAGQVAGLVQAGVIPSPFPHCDVVSIATHHTLRGPRAGIIFFRKGVRSVCPVGSVVSYDLARRLGQGVFPEQDQGPGLMLAGRADQIGSIAHALYQARTPHFKQYQQQIVRNAKRLCVCLQRRGYKVVTGGTDTHLLLVDLKPQCISGEHAEYLLERVNITCNRSTVPGDTCLEVSSGVTLGTPTLTTRGLDEESMETVADFIHRALTIAKETHTISRGRIDFKRVLLNDKANAEKIKALRNEVEQYAEMFPFPSLHEL